MSKDNTLNANALIDVEAARDYLRVTGAADDEVITAIVNEVSSFMETETRRVLKSRTMTFDIDGTGDGWNLLPQYPCTALTSAKYRDSSWALVDLDITDAAVFDSGEVYLPHDRFWTGRKNIRVEATVGYLAGTHDAELAALSLCCKRIVQIVHQDWKNKSGRAETIVVAGTGNTIRADALPKEVTMILTQFKRVA